MTHFRLHSSRVYYSNAHPQRSLCRLRARFRHFLVDHHCESRQQVIGRDWPCRAPFSSSLPRGSPLSKSKKLGSSGSAVGSSDGSWYACTCILSGSVRHDGATARKNSPPSKGASTLLRPRSAVWARKLGTSPSDRSPAKMKCERERERALSMRSEPIDTLVRSPGAQEHTMLPGEAKGKVQNVPLGWPPGRAG